MALQFEEIHAAPDAKKINEEWFVLSNTGGTPISTAGLSVIVSRPGKRGSVLGQIDPGFLLQPGELLARVAPRLEVVAYEHGYSEQPSARVVQRICAVGRGRRPSQCLLGRG